jgi:hypothetical protein
MTTRRCLLAFGSLASACFFPVTAAAAAQVQPPAQAQSRTALRCESDGSYQRCAAANTWRGARLVQQLSNNPCIQGRTWGFERDAIWVNNGCRGIFEPGDPFTNAGERVTCAGSGRTECPADTRYGVTLVRQLSQTACTEGSSWGYGGNVIWVDRGCRAEFQVGSAAAGGGGTGGGTTTEVTCGATTGLQVTCPTNGYATEVELARDLSNGRCREGSTWGHTDAFIWANRGCRGQFRITLAGDAGAPAQAGPVVISCGSTTGRQVVCETEGYATNVSLQQDQSAGRCRQGQTWGFSDSFIWTNGGCRGEFAITYRGGAPGGGGDVTRRVTCGSADNLRLACRPGGTVLSARLVRDLSASRCRQNSTWGWGGDTLWVTNGCVAEFSLTVGAAGGGARTITCGSTTGQQMSCSTGGPAADVRLVTDLSGGRCREGQSWGHTASMVWTNRGCRARFEVSYSGPGRN